MQYIKDAESCIVNGDSKNTSFSLQMAKMLDKTNKFKSEINNVIKKMNAKTNEPEIEKLIQKAKEHISENKYGDAHKLIDKLYDMIPDEDEEKINSLYDSITLHKITPQLNSYISSHEYNSAINYIVTILKDELENNLLKDKIDELEKLSKKTNQYDDIYKSDCELFESKDYKKAFAKIKEIIELTKNTLINIENYQKLEIKITGEISKKQTIQFAEKTYQQVYEMHESNNHEYKTMITSLNNAIEKCLNAKISKKEDIYVKCNNLLTNIRKKYNCVLASDLYDKALECCQYKNSSSALKNINDALEIFPDNNTYIELRNNIKI